MARRRPKRDPKLEEERFTNDGASLVLIKREMSARVGGTRPSPDSGDKGERGTAAQR